MKKVLSLILVAILLLGVFCACGNKTDDKTILRHTVNIAGIPTDTSIRFEINHGKGGPRYNIFGHHNKLSYIRRTSDAEVALKHFASTVNEIVGYCFEPPATQSAIWP